METFQVSDVLLNFISAVAGSILTVLATSLVSVYRTHRREANTAMKTQFAALAADREVLNNAHEKVRTDLQGQILELRRDLLTLQADNLRYVRENAELRQQVIYLTQENGELKVRLRELESQVARWTDGRTVTSTELPAQVTTHATDTLGTPA
jgi:chromosome segregation ATPase